MATTRRAPPGRNRGRRLRVIGVALLLIAGLGFALSRMPALYHVPRDVPAEDAPLEGPRNDPGEHAAQVRAQELRQRFDESVVMLHARKYEYAVASLHRVLELSPRMPEAHVNMGFALLGLRRPAAARDFFLGAIELNPRQANAYYGLAVAHEALEQLPEAIGAMRSYLHLSASDAKHRTRARAALWEWEAQRSGAGAAAQREATHE